MTLSSDGSFTYTPNADFIGTDTFTYEATDGVHTGDNIPLTYQGEVTIHMTNTDPVAADVLATVHLTQDLTIDLNQYVYDADGDAITISIVTNPTMGTLVDNGNGTVTYTAPVGFTGEETFTFEVTDVAMGGVLNLGEVTIIVTNTPPISFPDRYELARGTVLTVTAANGVLANDKDLDGDELFAELDDSVLAQHGVVALSSDGSFTYTPTNSYYSGNDSFRYFVSDIDPLLLPMAAGPEDPRSREVKIEITKEMRLVWDDNYRFWVDDPSGTGEFNVPIATGVLSNDHKGTGVTLQSTLDVGPGNGSVTLNLNGSFDYTPDPGFIGTDTFTYTVNDPLDVNDIATATIEVFTFSVQPPATVSVDHDNVLVDEGSLSAGVAMSESNRTVYFELVTGPTSAQSFELFADGSFVYVPVAGQVGSDSFVYKATNGREVINNLVAGIDVANDAPTALSDITYTIRHGRTLNVIGLLDSVIDADTNHLVAVLDSAPSNAAEFTLRTNGSFTYVPNANFVGADSFTYHVSDGQDSTSVATITIDVQNTIPQASSPNYTPTENETMHDGLLNGLTDGENDYIWVEAVGAPLSGLELWKNGGFMYTPSVVGIFTADYKITDGINESTGTITFDVQEALDDPDPGSPNPIYTLDVDGNNNGIIEALESWSGGGFVLDNAGPGSLTVSLGTNGGVDVTAYSGSERKGIANAADGFLLLFSASPFPGADFHLERVREDTGGNIYVWSETGQEGWLCPALLKYFDEPPANLHVQLKERK